MMAKYDCEICRGRGMVRLPIYRRANAVFTADPATTMEESSREYPCPECAEKVPFARVGVVGAIMAIDTRISDPKYIEHVKRAAVHNLIDEIVNGGYVKVEHAPPDADQLRQEYRVTLGVVSQEQVASLEQRIAERQIEIANEVVNEAEHQINSWGAYYSHVNILKSDAIRMVRESLKPVLAKRAAWHPDHFSKTG